MEKRLKCMKVIRWIGIAPFIILLIIGLISMGTGITFIFSKIYGFDALGLTIVLLGIGCWPIFVAATITIIVTSILIWRTKKTMRETHEPKDITT